MSAPGRERFVVIGGGLGGALTAVCLGKAGHEVELFERRPDPRVGPAAEGRSINLAISTRGIHAMQGVGLAEEVLREAVPMNGRMIHASDGTKAFQPYGTEKGQAIHSVSRGGLNRILVGAALRLPGVRVFFGKRCTGVDLETATAHLEDVETGEPSSVRGDVLVGADGVFSVVRAQMQRLDRFDYEQSYLGHGYKELHIPAGPGGAFPMEKNVLHIWPRGGFMTIALPNHDGSFTVTCFWPHDGPHGFSSLATPEDVVRYFGETFRDALPLMPSLGEDYFRNPTGSLVTVRCFPWHFKDRVVLLGDACHAVVPFYGQGANAAFEDCASLIECIAGSPGNLADAFARYGLLRKQNTDALALLAIENFLEMRDRTASRAFLLKKRLEKGLHRIFPRWFLPLYSMVTFSTIPYAAARRRALLQERTIRLVAAGGALVLLLLILIWAFAGS